MKVIKITTTTIPLPEGVTGGSWMFRVKDSAGDDVHGPLFSTTPDTPWPMSLPAGEYTLQGQRFNSLNNPLGPLVSGSYSWDGSGAPTVDVAGSIGVVDV